MATPKTNPEPIPGFDAVAESRKWREATSRQLNAMSTEERLAYLAEARARYLAGREETDAAVSDPAAMEDYRREVEAETRRQSSVVREDPPKP